MFFDSRLFYIVLALTALGVGVLAFIIISDPPPQLR